MEFKNEVEKVRSDYLRIKNLIAVVVIYKCDILDSETIRTMCALARLGYPIPNQVLVFDNGPVDQTDKVAQLKEFRVIYQFSSKNVGVAGAYNFALSIVADDDTKYLMLLDQDSIVGGEYLKEVEAALVNEPIETLPDLFLPKVTCAGRTISPIKGAIFYLPAEEGRGTKRKIRAINSGMIVSRRFVQGIGGFNKRLWLDGLDHWLLGRAYQVGSTIEVLRSTLNHDLSVAASHRIPLWRVKNILSAERVLYEEIWDIADRLIYIIKLYYRLIKYPIRYRSATLGKLILIQIVNISAGLFKKTL